MNLRPRRERSPEAELRNVRRRLAEDEAMGIRRVTLPTYEIIPTLREDSFPVSIAVRPLTTGTSEDENALARHLTSTLSQAVKRYVRAYTGWSIRRIAQNVRGVVVAVNLQDNNAGYSTGIERLSEMTSSKILDELQSIQESNTELHITDMEWVFEIDPSSLSEAGGKVLKPKWAKGYEKTWQDQGVNCAAFALIYYLSTKRQRENIKPMVERAKQMCERYGWGDTCTIQELEAFTKEFKQYRLVLFEPSANARIIHYDGEDYTLNDNKNVIYLGMWADHYALVESAVQAIARFRGTATMKWCHKCLVAYYYSTTHDCENPDVRKSIMTECEHCGIILAKTSLYLHRCEKMTCRICMAYVKKSEFVHRCPIIQDPWPESKNQWSTLPYQHMDGKLQGLWAYDFESRLQMESSVVEVVEEFEKDSNDKFTGQVLTYSNNVMKHEVNYIALQNVFTNERFSFFGDDCLDKFIQFAFQTNKGTLKLNSRKQLFLCSQR
jgi:hypothetical protein